jgi:hypothetical protein
MRARQTPRVSTSQSHYQRQAPIWTKGNRRPPIVCSCFFACRINGSVGCNGMRDTSLTTGKTRAERTNRCEIDQGEQSLADLNQARHDGDVSRCTSLMPSFYCNDAVALLTCCSPRVSCKWCGWKWQQQGQALDDCKKRSM